MGWPQIVWIALTAAGLAIALVKDGQPSKHSFIGAMAGTGIAVGLLWAGGFFG